MNDKDYLAHYGRLGMQWYLRLGPPYPLEQEYKDLYKKRMNMSDAEFEKAAQRVRISKEIAEGAGYIKHGKSWGLKFAERVSDTTSNQLGSMVGNSITNIFKS